MQLWKDRQKIIPFMGDSEGFVGRRFTPSWNPTLLVLLEFLWYLFLFVYNKGQQPELSASFLIKLSNFIEKNGATIMT